MQITRKSILTGEVRTREIACTIAQLDAHAHGMMAQAVFHNLSASDREFIMTGVTDEEWDAMIAAPEEDAPDYEEDRDDEASGPDDLSDDGDALASAGWGTDEDYGGTDDRI